MARRGKGKTIRYFRKKGISVGGGEMTARKREGNKRVLWERTRGGFDGPPKKKENEETYYSKGVLELDKNCKERVPEGGGEKKLSEGEIVKFVTKGGGGLVQLKKSNDAPCGRGKADPCRGKKTHKGKKENKDIRKGGNRNRS